MRIGRIEIQPVIDGTATMEPTALLSGTTDESWAGHVELLTPDGKLQLSIGGFLVRGHADRVVLIDTGFGADRENMGGLVPSLRAHEVEPEEVTDVVFTHLHADHIGGVTQSHHDTFANATFHCHLDDWTYFRGNAVPATGRPEPEELEAIGPRLSPWGREGGTILPGIDALPTPGHTPGSTVIVISSQGEKAMILGDVAHCAAQLLEPEWDGLFDFDPGAAKRAREAVARELVDSDVPVTGGHFPGLRFGRLIQGQDRRQIAFVTP